MAQSIQERWVQHVGGDPAVHDLARILRLPGTVNLKYDPPRTITTVLLKIDRLYELQDLAALLPDEDEHRGDDQDEIPPPAVPNNLPLKEVVDLAQNSADGEKFKRLWSGYDGEYDSTSEADLAFCCLLAFWTGGDYTKIDKLFRLSDRMRDKWQRYDYRHATLLKSLRQCTSHYVDPGGYLTAGANDEGNALCVKARCGSVHAYCDALGWLYYNGTHWQTQMAEAKVDLAIIRTLKERRVVALQSTTPMDSKRREAIVKAGKPSAMNVRNCKTLLKALIAAPITDYDQSSDKLNCPNGILNLRTGKLQPHDYKSKFTYCVAARYFPEADSSVWTEWLLDAVGGNQEVLDFLQLAVGYSLTGRTREEMMFYIYGPARAGKGTFTETILALLGGRPLATEVGMEIFVEKRRSSDQGFDLAGLKSTRFVAASESAEGQWLDATKLKRWTGGNWVTCAHKYGKPFSYQPQFKIWLSSNYPLQLDADDTAGWTRVQVIEFPNSYVGREDKTLKERMRSTEILEGVLAWAVAGAIKWYALSRGGLRAPKIVREQTEKARSSLDWVAQWIREDVEVTGDDRDRISNATIYQYYSAWCKEQGVSAKKMPALTRTLKRYRYKAGQVFRLEDKTTRGWKGARLKRDSLRDQLSKMSMGEDSRP